MKHVRFGRDVPSSWLMNWSTKNMKGECQSGHLGNVAVGLVFLRLTLFEGDMCVILSLSCCQCCVKLLLLRQGNKVPEQCFCQKKKYPYLCFGVLIPRCVLGFILIANTCKIPDPSLDLIIAYQWCFFKITPEIWKWDFGTWGVVFIGTPSSRSE